MDGDYSAYSCSFCCLSSSISYRNFFLYSGKSSLFINSKLLSQNCRIHFLFYSLLPTSVPVFFNPPPYQIAFIDVLLTLELPIVGTFGSFTSFRIPLPLRFIVAALVPFILLLFIAFLVTACPACWVGTLVLLFLTFLLSLPFSCTLPSFAFSSLIF